MLKKENVVIFDFDGTLSASDSNWEFFKYCFKHSLRPWLFLSFVIAGITAIKFNHNSTWGRKKMRCFITAEMVKDFSQNVIKWHKQNRFGWAKEQVAKEKKAGNKVLLISASPDYLVPELVKDMNFDAVICSQMKKEKPYEYNFFCWGKNKVIAMDNWAREHKCIPNLVRAYSDSKYDMPIMKIAKEQVWIDPKTGLRK